MKNLAKAVIAVMQEVKGMEKNSRVGTGNSSYNGTKDQDVKEVFNESLAKNGLCILPIGIQEETHIDRWEEVDPWSKSTPKDVKQKQSVFTKVTTRYLLLHESGESQELVGYGHGVDPQDKGAGKATTYALKNCLLYTFLTPVGKIDDTDTTHSEQIQTPSVAKQAKIPVAAVKKPITEAGFEQAKISTDIVALKKALDCYILTDEQVSFLKSRIETLSTVSK
jgi:hypothetical protein